MNVLLFVMTMLMIFITMTYTRLETYKTMNAVESQFTRYAENIERTYINFSADKTYDKTSFGDKTKDHEGEKPKTEKPKKVKTSGRLSLEPLVKNKSKGEHADTYKETVSILKELIQTLYGDQPHFKEILQDNQGIIDTLIDRIPKAVEELPKNIKIRYAVDLSNLELGNNLDELFYLMLKGCPSALLKPIATSEGASEDEEYTSDKAYDSLLNFVDLHSSLKINIYIASRPLLLAIYEDPAIVDKILSTRLSLHNAVENKEMTDSLASEKLKGEFENQVKNSLLEFKVTGSNPKHYN